MVHFQLRINKFYTFTASALIQVIGSPVYTFSIYATALGETLGLDQDQVAGLGTSMTSGLFSAIIAGSVYDQLEHHKRMGPRITIWVGAVLAAVGYSGLWLAATGSTTISYAGLLVLAFIAGNASSWYDAATIVTNVRNFPNNRGTVVGLLKSFVGLAGSIYSSVYASSFAPNAAAYLGLLAVASSLLPLLLSLGVNYVPYVEAAELHSFGNRFNPETRFLLAYVTVIVLALYQMTSALLGAMGEFPLPGAAGMDVLDFNTIGMFGILSVILLVPWNSGGLASRYVHEHLADPEKGPSNLPEWWHLLRLVDHHDKPLSRGSLLYQISGNARHMRHKFRAPASDSASYSGGTEIESLVCPAPAVSSASGGAALHEPLLLRHEQQQQQAQKIAAGVSFEADAEDHLVVHMPRSPSGVSLAVSSVECHHQFTNISLTQAARTLQFWLLFFCFIAGVGSCLTFLNHLGPLTIALGGVVGGQVAFVSTYAVGNAAGRILMGQVSENFLHTYGTPRTKWLVAVMACLTGAILSAAAATTPGHLYIVSPALGLCYGGMFTLIPAIAADLFGLRHFAANYAGLQTACVVGSYLMPKVLASIFYDRAVAEHGAGQPCIGRDCYGPTFVIEAVVCMLATACAGVVLATTKGVYQQLAQHLHEVEEEEHHDMIEQWQEEHHKYLVRRTLSDPSISATTGLPAGLLSPRGGLHNVKTTSFLQPSTNPQQQQATQLQSAQAVVVQDAKQRAHMASAASAPSGYLITE